MHASTRVSVYMRVRVCACVCTRVGEGSLTLEDRTWERRVGKWSGAEGAVGALWVEVSLLKGPVAGAGGSLASSRPTSVCLLSAGVPAQQPLHFLRMSVLGTVLTVFTPSEGLPGCLRPF